MSKSELRAYAQKHGISIAEARNRVKEEADSRNQQTITVLSIVHNGPIVEFQCVKASMSTHNLPSREELIQSIVPLSNQKNGIGHDLILADITVAYLLQSPVLEMVRSGFKADCLKSPRFPNHIHTIDLDDLGAVIEFTVNGKEITTNGPRWMREADVQAEAEAMKAQYIDTHDIRGQVA